MLTLGDMRRLARERVAEAALLVRAERYDTGVYLCGYAVEVSLKARICRTLRWSEFPNEPQEWKRHHSFLKVHDLELLSHWSGCGLELTKPPVREHWLEVTAWNPEMRYKLSGVVNRAESLRMLRAARALIDLLNPR
jgi:hypothetical protein